MMTDEMRQLGRAKNAVLAYFEHHLSIPKIYLDAEWDGRHIDVLAINRDGVGDVHVVFLFSYRHLENGQLDYLHEVEMERKLIKKLALVPAQFKYVGIIDSGDRRGSFNVGPTIAEETFAADGLGRVGFLTVYLPQHGEPKVAIEIKPERFRAKIAKLADEYVQQHEADWEIRA